MEVPGHLCFGYFVFETPFKSHYKVFGNKYTSLSIGILCNGLSSWIAPEHSCWSANLKPPSTATRNLCWPETCATDQTFPLHNSGRHHSHNHAVVIMYLSVSKTSVLMESPTKGTLGPCDRIPVVFVYSYCPLLHIFVVEEIRQTRASLPG